MTSDPNTAEAWKRALEEIALVPLDSRCMASPGEIARTALGVDPYDYEWKPDWAREAR